MAESVVHEKAIAKNDQWRGPRSSGALWPEEADELERVIEEGCEKIDEHGW